MALRSRWLPAVVLLATVSGVLFAQPPGGRFPGPPTMPGPPPGVGGPPGGIGGMPGPPPGIGGRGIGGMPDNTMPGGRVPGANGGVPENPGGPPAMPGPRGPNFPRTPEAPELPNRGLPVGPAVNGGMENDWQCEKCKHKFTSSTTPKSCPNCRTNFTEITDEFGNTKKTSFGTRSYVKVIGGIAIMVVIGIFTLIKVMSGSGSSRPVKKVKKKKKPVYDDDDDYDDDDRPRKTSRRRED
jgi:hypothetical protein